MFLKKFKFKALIFFLFSILFFSNDITHACKCNHTISIKEHFTNAAFVFEGRIESVWPKLILKSNYIYQSGILVQSYKFRIFKKWKGEIKGNSIVLFSTGSNCDSYFMVGETYLVYAIRDIAINNRLTSNQCTGTVESREAIEDFKFLGPGEIVTEPTVNFVPETKFRRIFRHSWLYILGGVWNIRNFPHFIKAGDEIDMKPYIFLLMHLTLVLIIIGVYFSIHKKIKIPVSLSLICLLFSGFGTFFLKHAVFIGISFNLFLLFILFFYYLFKTKIKLALSFLFLFITFSLIELIISGYLMLRILFDQSLFDILDRLLL